MKLVYNKCKRDKSEALRHQRPGTVVRFKNCVSDIGRTDPCLVVDLRSYEWQLDEAGCGDKIGVINLTNNKLSLLLSNRGCYPVRNVEVHIS